MGDFYQDAARPAPGSMLSGPPGSAVPQYAGWDPAGDGGPDEPGQCEVVVFHGSPNPDSAAFGPDEACENDAEPDSTVCAEHAYVLDEPSFGSYR